MAVQLNGNAKSLIYYAGGIIDTKECKPGSSHAVLAVGYDTDKSTGKEYFIIKNTWGKYWGE